MDLKKTKVAEDNSYTIRGVLYKHGTNDIGNQETAGFFNDMKVCVVSYHDAYELTEPEDYACEAAWQPLLNLYENKNNYDYVKTHYYLDNMAEYTLFIIVFSIIDNWGNKNNYLSARNIQSDDDRMRIVYTPWDLDTSLGGNPTGQNYDGNYSDWKIQDIIKSASSPFSTCFQQQEFKQLVKDKWIAARTGSLSIKSVATRLYNYRDLFINSGAWQRQCDYFDAQKYKPCYVNDLAKEIDYIVEWYRQRVIAVDDYFNISPAGIQETISNPDSSSSSKAVYDLNGIKMDNEKWQKGELPKGLYFQKGKKWMR